MKKNLVLILLLVSLCLTTFRGQTLAKGGNDWEAKVISSDKVKESGKIKEYKDYSYKEILEDMLALDLISKEVFDLKLSAYDKNDLVAGNSVNYRKIRGESYTVKSDYGGYVLTPCFYIGVKREGEFLNNMKQATIVSVERPYLEIESDGEYRLQGSIFYKLEGGDSIYYGVNGDLRQDRVLKSGSFWDIVIGRLINLYYGIIHVDLYIKNFQFDGRLHFSTYSR